MQLESKISINHLYYNRHQCNWPVRAFKNIYLRVSYIGGQRWGFSYERVWSKLSVPVHPRLVCLSDKMFVVTRPAACAGQPQRNPRLNETFNQSSSLQHLVNESSCEDSRECIQEWTLAAHIITPAGFQIRTLKGNRLSFPARPAPRLSPDEYCDFTAHDPCRDNIGGLVVFVGPRRPGSSGFRPYHSHTIQQRNVNPSVLLQLNLQKIWRFSFQISYFYSLFVTWLLRNTLSFVFHSQEDIILRSKKYLLSNGNNAIIESSRLSIMTFFS